MAWIESHQNLENHPKLNRFIALTGFDINEAIGFLHRLWWWVLAYAEDGALSKYDYSQFLVRLTNKIESKVLFDVLIECNFVENDGKNIKIHDWWDYAGRYLTGKYRTSNPAKLKEIMKLYKSDKRPTKVCQTDRLKSDNLPTSTHLNLPNLPNKEYISLTQEFKNLILTNKPDYKFKSEGKWSSEFKRMVEIDKRNPDRIREVMRWALNDPFWKANILSPSKLREKFDQLEIKMGEEEKRNANIREGHSDVKRGTGKGQKESGEEDPYAHLIES